jgi:hypothetical protein
MFLEQIIAALADARPDLRLTPRHGPNGSVIIDDSYNASPASMIAALDLMVFSPPYRRPRRHAGAGRGPKLDRPSAVTPRAVRTCWSSSARTPG